MAERKNPKFIESLADYLIYACIKAITIHVRYVKVIEFTFNLGLAMHAV